MNTTFISNILNILKKLIISHILFLIIMSLFRTVFFYYYSPLESLDGFILDILNAFFLGFRLDLTVVGYIQAMPTIILIFLYYFKNERLLNYSNQFFIFYLFVAYTIVSFFLCADFGFYSYFKDHINILFFGLFDDDTTALLITFWQNYNVFLILFIFFIYLFFLFRLLATIFNSREKKIVLVSIFRWPSLFFLSVLLLNFLAIRGTFGMYPLGKMLPNISENDFINKISHNGFRAFTNALSARKKYLKRKYDLLEATGFKNNIENAFEIYNGSKNINRDNLLENITHTTTKHDDTEYNVVIIMVESFGMPILNYQSEDFNILGALEKHFKQDILLKKIISAGDGTISSLQALLLNIPHRPNSYAFSQSIYKQTSFRYGPAFLYKSEGYETTFIYGGDLTWRNLGNFLRYQGYDNIEGKINIFNALKNKHKDKDQLFHPWGIFDEYLYSHILIKLEKSTKKQFIVALSTNNHPPYTVPSRYKNKRLVYRRELKDHITGDFDLAQQRFASYAYAVDQVGIFLDKFKESKFKENTIIVITADNNTIDGIMKYDDNTLLNSKNIPLYFYLPTGLRQTLSINTNVSGSHKDIFPTLYNLTLKNKKYIALGQNLFDKNKNHFGFNGSKVVSHNDKIKKYQTLKNKITDEMLNYYRANLAITEYLIQNEYKRGKKNRNN
ncbi:MAG: phosphoglycerol transferase [Desulfobacterales bacterium]|nr:MAG: phosphoglycerol transferase [Desulfobacterales bacterium]